MKVIGLIMKLLLQFPGTAYLDRTLRLELGNIESIDTNPSSHYKFSGYNYTAYTSRQYSNVFSWSNQ